MLTVIYLIICKNTRIKFYNDIITNFLTLFKTYCNVYLQQLFVSNACICMRVDLKTCMHHLFKKGIKNKASIYLNNLILYIFRVKNKNSNQKK